MRATSARLAVLLTLLLGLLAGAPPGQSATFTVVVQNMAFTPKTLSVGQGSTVTWDFRESGHTTTSRQRFWRSAFLAPGDTFRVVFRDAGSFGYLCEAHGSMGMVGTVLVPLRRSGTASTGWTLRWSSRSTTPSSRSYDVQVRAPGSSTWTAFRTSTAARSASFDPSRTGTYAFRARTDNHTTGQSSGWSRTLSVPIS